MAIYFTIQKSQTESLTVIFAADAFTRARRYKQGLVLDHAYREGQIRISGTDSTGKPVQG